MRYLLWLLFPCIGCAGKSINLDTPDFGKVGVAVGSVLENRDGYVEFSKHPVNGLSVKYQWGEKVDPSVGRMVERAGNVIDRMVDAGLARTIGSFPTGTTADGAALPIDPRTIELLRGLLTRPPPAPVVSAGPGSAAPPSPSPAASPVDLSGLLTPENVAKLRAALAAPVPAPVGPPAPVNPVK